TGGAEGDSKEPLPDDPADEKPLEDPCQPVEGPKMCVPPGGWGYDTGNGGVATGGEVPREETDPTGEGDDGVIVEDGEPPTDEDDAEEPGGEDQEPATDDATEEDDDEDDTSKDDAEEDADEDKSSDEGSDSDDGGCSVQA